MRVWNIVYFGIKERDILGTFSLLRGWLRVVFIRQIIAPLYIYVSSSDVVTQEELRSYAREHRELFDPELSRGADISPEEFRARRCGDVEMPNGSYIRPVAYNFNNPLVCEFNDVTLYGPAPIARTREGDILLDSVGYTDELNWLEAAVTRTILSMGPRNAYRFLNEEDITNEDQQEIDCACLITGLWHNYGHWTTDHLLKFRSLEQYVGETGEQPTLILQKDPPDFVLEYLDMLGWEKSDYVEWQEASMKVGKLVLPTYPHVSPEDIQWIRDTLVPRAHEQAAGESSLSERIYVSRRKARARRVQNEDEVMDLLEEYGFELYILEDMDLATQIRLFSNAEIVVGPTGSGFTNIVYAEDPTVIELVSHKAGMTWCRISQMMGFDHYHLFCRRQGKRGGDSVVDIENLEAQLQSVLEGSGEAVEGARKVTA